MINCLYKCKENSAFINKRTKMKDGCIHFFLGLLAIRALCPLNAPIKRMTAPCDNAYVIFGEGAKRLLMRFAVRTATAMARRWRTYTLRYPYVKTDTTVISGLGCHGCISPIRREAKKAKLAHWRDQPLRTRDAPRTRYAVNMAHGMRKAWSRGAVARTG